MRLLILFVLVRVFQEVIKEWLAFCRFAVAVRAVVREDGAEAAAEGTVEDRDANS